MYKVTFGIGTGNEGRYHEFENLGTACAAFYDAFRMAGAGPEFDFESLVAKCEAGGEHFEIKLENLDYERKST